MDTPDPATEQESPPISPQEYVETLAKKAKATAAQVAILSTTIKDQALRVMAEGLEAKSEEILAANEQDLESLGKEQETQALEDRLRLTPERITEMASGLREIAKLPDPLGQAPKLWRRPNGMMWSVHSRRSDPMTRSANAFCHGDRGADRIW